MIYVLAAVGFFGLLAIGFFVATYVKLSSISKRIEDNHSDVVRHMHEVRGQHGEVKVEIYHLNNNIDKSFDDLTKELESLKQPRKPNGEFAPKPHRARSMSEAREMAEAGMIAKIEGSNE